MKKFLNDFKEFALRGNVAQLAIGIVIGNAFNNIISSFVSDIIMPIFASLLGASSFKELNIVLPGHSATEPAILYYGSFIQNMIDFLIITLSIFLVIKVVSRLANVSLEEEQVAMGPSEEALLLREIRDALVDKKDAGVVEAVEVAVEPTDT